MIQKEMFVATKVAKQDELVKNLVLRVNRKPCEVVLHPI
ncbi:hypothetical protein HWB52_gp08 [Pseudomonas phage Littlefix]|uniref:Uncharacterized protein n=1 Tax=Pseudomonas phage Littlefix TaxID=2079289 RepID=A0A2K9VHJ5_9CAUD|nr:hypothetical protein HWB52_gp08 [Pseudomonas phage Littlefix]AUV61823.1 hypothetical protein PsPhLittlefix_gp08 [Pseudomonas phage Littlefix]